MRAIVREQAMPSADVRQLRARVEQLQGRRMDAAVLPTHPALAELLPGGGLRAGSVYSLAPSASLLLALLARPSQDGSWCGVVGMPELGAEAAEHLGVDLSRLVMIPDPGPRWLAVAATVFEVLPVVAVRPAGTVHAAEASRLMARLRDHGSVLLVQGVWPQAEASLSVSDAQWSGVGSGHGYLADRALTVTVHSRRSPVPRSARLLLPDSGGRLAAAPSERMPVARVPLGAARLGAEPLETAPLPVARAVS
ncbi:hypothetical protein AB1K54_14205 [Microbacterium sp. BWT-B31]|uniref:hypothetical protein n=1 Tax=Microbacterium sp. BWT-B31 TaxID=3232072 RepID=UPI00352796A5